MPKRQPWPPASGTANATKHQGILSRCALFCVPHRGHTGSAGCARAEGRQQYQPFRRRVAKRHIMRRNGQALAMRSRLAARPHFSARSLSHAPAAARLRGSVRSLQPGPMRHESAI